MNAKRLLIAFGLIVVLWLGFLAAAKWAGNALNDGRKPPTAESIIQRSPAGSSSVLPSYWDVPGFAFPNQDAKPVTDHDLRGHVWVADFIFTQCVTACPIMTSKMILLQKQLHQPGVRFVSFSVDPEHDSPAALKKYATLWQGDEARWELLSTDPAGLAAVTKGMHVAVDKSDDADNPIIHSSLFMLIDTAGRVRGLYNSIDGEAMEKLVVDTNALAGDAVASPTTALAIETGSAVERGALVYQSMGCLACHSQSRIAPPLTAVFNGQVRLADHRTVWADEAYLHESVVDPNAKVVSGYLPSMPSYRGLLTDDQVSDVLEYIKSLSPNGAGGHGMVATTAVTQPATQTETELLVKDPVCKMRVRAESTAPHASFDGHDYFFCSDNCRERFLKDPKHYTLTNLPSK